MTSPAPPTLIYTIGHSTHRIERFVELLQTHGITALADVRSTPYSRFNPQFNRETLKQSLNEEQIQYVFLGEELGARSKDPCCYENGRVDFKKLTATASFQNGMERLQTGMATHSIAMMCAEKEPLDCHRTILVARELERRGITVAHILDDGSVEPHGKAISRLRRQLNIPEHDLFRSDAELIEETYLLQSQRIAYVDDSLKSSPCQHAQD